MFFSRSSLRFLNNLAIKKTCCGFNGQSKSDLHRNNSSSLAVISEVNDSSIQFCSHLSDNHQLVQKRSYPIAVFNAYLDQKPISIFFIDVNGENSKGEWKFNSNLLSECEQHSIYWIDNFENNETLMNKSNDNPTNNERPGADQLEHIYNELVDNLPKFFVAHHNYKIYNQNIIFENNLRGVTTQGIIPYMQQISIIKILAHIKYSHIKMEILKITRHPEDGTIRVRWRAVGVPGLRKIFMFWKYKLWQWNQMMSKDRADWIDGFSIFYVGSDGLIFKHVCDKIIPDEERTPDIKNNTNVAVKLAMLIGLVNPSNNELDDLPVFFSSMHMTSNPNG